MLRVKIVLHSRKSLTDKSGSLFAVPIPPSTSYFAYGLIAMSIGVTGADVTYPALTLFTAQSLPKEDQAIGGALINAVGQVGRAIGLAIATAIQVAVQAKLEGKTVTDVGHGSDNYHNDAFLQGIRAAEWLNVAYGIFGFIIVVVFMRKAGKIGAVKK